MTLVEILMERDGLTSAEAESDIADCRREIYAALDTGEDAEEVFTGWFGLEPDYLWEVL